MKLPIDIRYRIVPPTKVEAMLAAIEADYPPGSLTAALAESLAAVLPVCDRQHAIGPAAVPVRVVTDALAPPLTALLHPRTADEQDPAAVQPNLLNGDHHAVKPTLRAGYRRSGAATRADHRRVRGHLCRRPHSGVRVRVPRAQHRNEIHRLCRRRRPVPDRRDLCAHLYPRRGEPADRPDEAPARRRPGTGQPFIRLGWESVVISIEHSHAEGTVVRGTDRGDGTNLVIKATRDGWKFSRSIGTGAWYLPHSRDRHADRARIERLVAALHDAGYEVDARVDDTRRQTTEIEADRAERVAGRVERYDEWADARHTAGGARLEHVRERRSHIPLGQPVMGVRDANYRARLNRIEDSTRVEIAVGDHWRQRAKAAEITQRYRHNPRVITRRIARLEAEKRRRQRSLDTVRAGGSHGEYAEGGQYADAAPDSITRAHDEIARLGEEIVHWRGELAALEATDVYRAWTREHFRVGDEARVIGTWYPVLRVNAKSVTVTPLVFGGQRRLDPDGKDVWTDTARYDKVHGRRRAGRILHTPPPPEGATCTGRVTIATFNAEVIPERGGGPCTEPPVARLTVRHDGTSCGCEGLCQVTDPQAPDDASGGSWTEIVLYCADHAAVEHEAIGEYAQSPAVTYEDLS